MTENEVAELSLLESHMDAVKALLKYAKKTSLITHQSVEKEKLDSGLIGSLHHLGYLEKITTNSYDKYKLRSLGETRLIDGLNKRQEFLKTLKEKEDDLLTWQIKLTKSTVEANKSSKMYGMISVGVAVLTLVVLGYQTITSQKVQIESLPPIQREEPLEQEIARQLELHQSSLDTLSKAIHKLTNTIDSTSSKN